MKNTLTFTRWTKHTETNAYSVTRADGVQIGTLHQPNSTKPHHFTPSTDDQTRNPYPMTGEEMGKIVKAIEMLSTKKSKGVTEPVSVGMITPW